LRGSPNTSDLKLQYFRFFIVNQIVHTCGWVFRFFRNSRVSIYLGVWCFRSVFPSITFCIFKPVFEVDWNYACATVLFYVIGSWWSFYSSNSFFFFIVDQRSPFYISLYIFLLEFHRIIVEICFDWSNSFRFNTMTNTWSLTMWSLIEITWFFVKITKCILRILSFRNRWLWNAIYYF
jgi:hypothetical protein